MICIARKPCSLLQTTSVLRLDVAFACNLGLSKASGFARFGFRPRGSDPIGQVAMSAFEELGICPEIIQAVEEDLPRANDFRLCHQTKAPSKGWLWKRTRVKNGESTPMCKASPTFAGLYPWCWRSLCQDDWLLPTPVQQEASRQILLFSKLLMPNRLFIQMRRQAVIDLDHHISSKHDLKQPSIKHLL